MSSSGSRVSVHGRVWFFGGRVLLLPVLVLDGDGVYRDRDVLRRRDLAETLRSGIVPEKYYTIHIKGLFTRHEI